MYRPRHAICDILLALGATAMLFSAGFFLFILLGAVSSRNAYLGVVTVVFLPAIFLLGAMTLILGRVLDKRLNQTRGE